MIKKVISALICLMIVAVPFSITAVAEEKDYSYLEDMSIKELRELDEAIHKLLPKEVEDETEHEQTVFPEEDENGFSLDIEEEHYKMALESCGVLYDSLNDPDSIQIMDVFISDSTAEIFEYYGGHTLFLIYTAGNLMGGTEKNCSIFHFDKDNEYQKCMLSFPADRRPKDAIYLNADFINENKK